MFTRKMYAVLAVCLMLSGMLAAAPYVVPDTGWTGATADPAMVGSPGDRGYDCQAIARFDVVPHQTFTDTFNVGIVAFHLNGIDRVEIAADGGTWTTVTEMTYNERTRVVEYWATLKASDFSDGMSELRAVIYPKSAGEPRVLSGLELYANGGGTLAAEEAYVSPADGNDTTGNGTSDNPYRTFQKGMEHFVTAPGGGEGATLYLDEGVYQFANASKAFGFQRWVTICPWPGVARDKVVFSGAPAGGTLQKYLHLRSITINHSLGDVAAFKLRSSPYGNRFWIDSCETYGTGYAGDSLSSGSFVSGGTQYLTDHTTHDHKGTLGGAIVRHLDAWYLSGDFVNSRGLNINCHLRHMRPAPGVHPDIVQHYSGTTDNYIMYGLKAIDAKAQGINIGQLDTVRDIALVNVQIEHYPTSLRNFIPSAAGVANHILMWNNMYTGASTVPGESRTDQTNLDIRGCVFSNINLGTGDYSGWTMDNNHFGNQDDVTGTNATYGDLMFTAAPVWDSTGRQITPGDYEIQSGSPLLGRMDNVLVPVDVDGNPRKSPSAVGPYAGPEETSINNGQLTIDKKLPVLQLPNPITAAQLAQFRVRAAGYALHDLQGRLIADWSTAETGIYTLVSGKMSFKIMVSGKN